MNLTICYYLHITFQLKCNDIFLYSICKYYPINLNLHSLKSVKMLNRYYRL